MTKLNQIVAIEKGVKAKTHSDVTLAYHQIQKMPLLSGLSRTYQPKDDEGDQLPAEHQRVQVRAEEALDTVALSLTRLFDVTSTKDWTNCVAKADVAVTLEDGTTVTLAEDVPVPYLLFLEKQLTDVHTFVSKLPTLDPSETWEFNDAANCWASRPTRTTKTKKVLRNHVKAEATDRHPAQVETYSEDVLVGYWTAIRFSGCVPATRVKELLERVETLQRAVKFAREQANVTPVTDVKVGEKLFKYLIEGTP